MTTAGELFAISVAIYLIDCFRWVARSALLLRRLPLLGASVGRPGEVGAQFRRALAFGFPLPIGSLFVAEPLPLRPGPAGVLIPSPSDRTWTTPSSRDVFVPWSELHTLRIDDLQLHGANGLLHTFGARGAAKATQKLLDGLLPLVTASPSKRLTSLEQLLSKRFKPRDAGARLERWRRIRTPLMIANLMLFAAIFGGLGMISFTQTRIPAERVLYVAVATWIAALIVNVLTVRRALPVDSRPSRGQWAMSIVSPLGLIRGADLVEAELVAGEEPAVLASLLLPPESAGAWLDQATRELRHPLSPQGLEPLSAEVQASVDWLRALLGEKVKALTAGKPTPPRPNGLHCPRCLTGYEKQVSECSSCPGVVPVG